MHVVIPAAGEGRRFAEAGYAKPKPLIDVLGKPMIQRVIENVAPAGAHVTVVSQVPIDILGPEKFVIEPTGGAVETILHAGIGRGPLLIANCDQITTLDMAAFVQAPGDGAVAVFRSSKPHHSYVQLQRGWIANIAEKEVISPMAVAGVYYFADGERFLEAALDVVKNGDRVHGEFYVSTVIARMIADGAKLRAVQTDVAILGTPDELRAFLVAARVAAAL